MSNTLKYLGVAVVAGLLVVAGYLVKKPVTTVVTNNVPGESKATLGALTGPDIPYSYFSFGGVRRFAARVTSLNQASTTACAIQSPSATSTLITASLYIRTATTTASVVTLARAANNSATTTQIGQDYAIASLTQADIIASTTRSDITHTSGLFFPPNQWLVWGLKGAGGGFYPTGSCSATWEAI